MSVPPDLLRDIDQRERLPITIGPVSDAVIRHHQVPVQDPNPILDTVIMANWVTKTIGVGLGAEGLNFDVDESVALRLGFRHTDFSLLCSRVASLMEDLKNVYGPGEKVA